jgi:pimeloyl-ACP methyl ester carboxylesterase
LGLSGGGSHVLALASAAPTVIRAGVALNPGPPSDDAVLALLPRQNRMVIGIARDHPRVFRLLVKPLEADGGRLARAIQRRSFDPTDLEVLQRPEVVRYVVPATIAGKRQPHAFAADALTLWGAPWNVDLSTFQVPLHVFAGVRDPFCAFADSLGPAGAEIRHSPGGHLSFWVPDKLDEVMKVVAAG